MLGIPAGTRSTITVYTRLPPKIYIQIESQKRLIGKKKFSLTLCGWSSLSLRVGRSRTLVVKMTTNTGSYLVEGSTLWPLSLWASFKRAGKTLFPSLILALASYLLEPGKIPGAHRGPAPSLYLVLLSGFNSSKTGCVIICLLRLFSAAIYIQGLGGVEPSEGGEDDGARLSTRYLSPGWLPPPITREIQRELGSLPVLHRQLPAADVKAPRTHWGCVEDPITTDHIRSWFGASVVPPAARK